MPMIKNIFILVLFSCLLYSCTFTNNGKGKKQELTLEQASAFEALTTLQVSSDEMNRLYSTFPGIEQPCYPPDTSLIITQSELLIAMTKFVKENYKRLNIEKQDQLINNSVLAQMEYTVFHCSGGLPNINYEDGLPMVGTWIMPSVLGRSDVVIVW